MYLKKHTLSIFHRSHQAVRLAQQAGGIFLILMWVFSPVAPILRDLSLPFLKEPITLGFEVGVAEAAFDSGYTYRRTITIQHGQVTGSANLTNFPVLMSFTQSEFRTTGFGGRVTDDLGDDIIFASDTQGLSPLDHEMERYNGSTGEVTAWVRVPTLDFDDDTIVYMFYGNSSVTSTQEDITGVWDSNYKGVWHLHETSGSHLDSTSNNNDSTGVTVTTQGSASGKFSGADQFDGINDVVTLTENGTLDITNTGTIEAWVNTTSTSTSPTSSMSSWTSRTAPTGISADEYSQLDFVIVGERAYFGNVSCADAADTFRTASSTLSFSSFTAWTATSSLSSSPPGACAAGEGSSIGVDSNGEFIWYAILNNDGTTATFSYATSTLAGAFSAWKTPGNPTGIGGDESSSIDVVITGNKAYFYVMMLNGNAENDMVASVSLDGSGWSGWIDPNNTPPAGTASEGCGASVNTDGTKLYIAAMCGLSTNSNYARTDIPLDLSSTGAFTDDADPTATGSLDHSFNDATLVGDFLYHAAFTFSDATESYSHASSTLTGTTPALSWTNLGTGNPDATADTNSADPAIETDGKRLFYSAFAHNGTTPVWTTASSTLPAHPFVSKLNAYELIQTAGGYVIDWAGKPTSFGTTTKPNRFSHVAVTHTGSVMNYYINGALYASTTVTTDFTSNNNALLFGQGSPSAGVPIYFSGVIDEVRVSDTARDADWIKTGYNNQNATSTFYTLSAETENTTAPTVTTNFANAGFNSATLHGTKTGGSNATEHGFAYGTGATLSGGDTATTTLGALTSHSAFISGVGQLSASTPYYFRAYATNAAGTGLGVIKSFTTGNSTASRMLRLFQGATTKLLHGARVILHQQ
jgi:hypothetical protein